MYWGILLAWAVELLVLGARLVATFLFCVRGHVGRDQLKLAWNPELHAKGRDVKGFETLAYDLVMF